MKIYAYNLFDKSKFETTIEKILNQINCDSIFSDDEYFYTSKEDRDFHFDQNVKENKL
tara:strand:+ start:257 stop:430 length:174 start_codon:yes stop_codon:yes gene_type:complete